MANVFIHVGPHKTGSTYIQKQLRENAAVLAEHGVSYPDLKSPVYGHGALARRLRGWGPPVTAEEMEALTDQPTLVLSSENFVLLSEEQLRHLRATLAGHDITVVFTLRSLTKTLPSHWQETVKHGNPQTYLEYLARIHGWLEGSYEQVIPSTQLAKLAAVFGRDDLRLISYENSEDLFETFGRVVLGTTSPVFAGDGARVNPSYSAERVELVRQLNRRFHSAHKGRTPGRHLRMAYTESSGAFEASAQFQAFAAAFGEVAMTIRLADSDPFIQAEASRVDAAYGDLVVNPVKSTGADAASVTEQRSETRCALASWQLSPEVDESLDALYHRLEPTALELLGGR
ncbi:hypothetical protein GCM10009809_28290 [Isoptericola hypogeus]|uniref:Sulfotransferase domain-containing protein n=1 Tax=Isoptericola hypogeus TaxID=300179 RepID=A0ABP4VQN4_9MICO